MSFTNAKQLDATRSTEIVTLMIFAGCLAGIHAILPKDIDQFEAESRNVLLDLVNVVFGDTHFFALLLLSRYVASYQRAHHLHVTLFGLLFRCRLVLIQLLVRHFLTWDLYTFNASLVTWIFHLFYLSGFVDFGLAHGLAQTFRCWEQVERGGNSATSIEVTHPKSGTSEFPFSVSFALQTPTCQIEKRGKIRSNNFVYRNSLIRTGHHGNQHVQQDDNVDNRIRSEHQKAPEARETLTAGQFKGLQIHQTEAGPKQRLRSFKEAKRNFRVRI